MFGSCFGKTQMIRYSLKCPQDHSFESWFASSDAFEALKSLGHVTCPACGARDVEKALMAPRIAAAQKHTAAHGPAQAETSLSAPAPDDPRAQALARLRDEVERNSEYVGLSFAAEARKIHEGEAPHRAIYGEARPDEARALIDDGVPIAPLPFLPRRRAN